MNNNHPLIKIFLPNAINRSLMQHRKASILIFTHFYIIIALIALLLLSSTVYNAVLIPSLCAIPFLVFSLIAFKKIGNINLSGNILSTIWLVCLSFILLKTGGLHSSFLPWLYSIIFIMVLVESYLWASIWFFVASFMCIGLYVVGHNYPDMNNTQCTDFDTCVSYLTVGFFMFTNLIVFEKHQVFVIKLFRAKNEELKEQKRTVAQQVVALKNIQAKLTNSNEDLKTFAYVASHDLKEPLRMITMYTQLLERKLKTALDDNAKEYVFFITDGVKRMQQLLDNLLAYSLLGKNQKEVETVDLNKKIATVMQNLTVRIQETNASIQYSNLPTIKASETEMVQLFQNIIANALKFRRKDINPIIHISCEENLQAYHFAIRDNGIGIKQEDQRRIFDLFTRLNGRDVYEGTGIGLATCKKILVNLNGSIWVTSTEGVGTTFHFSIPKNESFVASEIEEEEMDFVLH
jgi:signal transduction histidine kinase